MTLSKCMVGQDRDERVDLRRSAEAALLAGPDTKLCPGTVRILTSLSGRPGTPGGESDVDGDTLRSHPLPVLSNYCCTTRP